MKTLSGGRVIEFSKNPPRDTGKAEIKFILIYGKRNIKFEEEAYAVGKGTPNLRSDRLWCESWLSSILAV